MKNLFWITAVLVLGISALPATAEAKTSETYPLTSEAEQEVQPHIEGVSDVLLTPDEFAQNQENVNWDQFSEDLNTKHEEFLSSLENIPVDARQKAINEHKQQLFQEKIAFQEKLHADYIAYLQEEMDKIPTITQGEREDVIDFFEKQNEENIAFLRKQSRQNDDFYDDVGDEYRATQEQNERIEQFLSAQAAQNASHFSHQREQNVDKLSSIVVKSHKRERAY